MTVHELVIFTFLSCLNENVWLRKLSLDRKFLVLQIKWQPIELKFLIKAWKIVSLYPSYKYPANSQNFSSCFSMLNFLNFTNKELENHSLVVCIYSKKDIYIPTVSNWMPTFQMAQSFKNEVFCFLLYNYCL